MTIKVMKGVEYTQKRLEKWLKEDGAVVVQPKRDEIRCVVKVDISGTQGSGTPAAVTYTSASGKPLYNLECFDSIWITIALHTRITEFDCGCLVDNSFDVTRSVLRSSKKKYDLIKRAVFYFYDLPPVHGGYTARFQRIQDILDNYQMNCLSTPQVVRIATVEEADYHFDCYLGRGLEGAMYKRLGHLYKYGRSNDWMKRKPHHEVDCKITGYEAGKGKYEGLIGSLVAVDAEGTHLSFSGFTDEQREEVTRDFPQYMGRIAEVKYMQRDSQGGYRHPRFYRWHPDKVTLN